MPAAHAVNTTAGRRGRRADVNGFIGRGIGVGAPDGTPKELEKILNTPIDVPADIVGVARLNLSRRHDTAREDAIFETGGKAFDLIFDARGSINRRTVRHMTVRPEGMLAVRRTGVVKERGLDGEDERRIGNRALPCGAFGGGDFVERRSDVYRRGAQRLFCRPRNG